MASHLEQRLDTHMHSWASVIDEQPTNFDTSAGTGGLTLAIERGTRKRRMRTSMIAVAAALGLGGLTVGTMALIQRGPDATMTATADPANVAIVDTARLAAPRQAEPTFVWDGTASTASANTGSTTGVHQHNAASIYAIATAPGAPNQLGIREHQLARSTDGGLTFERVGSPLGELLLSDIADDGADSIYAIGTSPAQQGVRGIVSVVSTDGGATVTTHPLPIDTAAIIDAFGGVSTSQQNIAYGDGTIVATVSPTVDAHPTLVASVLPEGVDASSGINVTAQGVEIFGPPDDLAAVSATVCPTSWSLSNDPESVLTIYNLATTPEHRTNDLVRFDHQWFCLSGEDNPKTPQWVDPSRVHGPVVDVVPYDQVAGGVDVIKALQRLPRVFVSNDGATWTEADLPDAVPMSYGPSQLLYTGSRFAAMFASADGPQLYLGDGSNWAKARTPAAIRWPGLVALPDGSLLMAGWTGTQFAAYTSADGQNWLGVALSDLVGLDDAMRPLNGLQIASNQDGAAVAVTFYQDPLAALGGVMVEHDNFSLRMIDQNSTLQLVDDDGAVLDTCAWPMSDPVVSSSWLRVDAMSGAVTVTDPNSGVVVDAFVLSDLYRAYDELVNSDANFGRMSPRTAVIFDTADGAAWSATSIDGFGVASQQAYPSGAFATDETLTFTSTIFDNAGGSTIAVVYGRRQ